jgi:hypothetical protein
MRDNLRISSQVRKQKAGSYSEPAVFLSRRNPGFVKACVTMIEIFVPFRVRTRFYLYLQKMIKEPSDFLLFTSHNPSLRFKIKNYILIITQTD